MERGLLKFGTDIGTWRLEEKKTITLPTQLYTYKFNEVPKIPKIAMSKLKLRMNGTLKQSARKLC